MQVEEKRSASPQHAGPTDARPRKRDTIVACPHFVPADRAATGDAAALPSPSWRWRTRRILAAARLPAVMLVVFCCLFVGHELAERHVFSQLSVGWRHATLVAAAFSLTTMGCGIVFVMMRRQQFALSDTAARLTGALETYLTVRGSPNQFENPYLVTCCDVFACRDGECPRNGSDQPRCWQALALANSDAADPLASRVSLERCHGCRVYHASCPDRITALTESFNNLIFLLEEEARQRARLRDHMVQAEKMVSVGRFASGLADEVVNPLASISSVVQMLRRQERRDPETDQLECIEKHIQRITATVRGLVKLGRPSEQQWVDVDVNRAVEEAMRLIALDPRAKNVEIRVETAPDLPATHALRGQIQQLVINLATNSLEAMPRGGQLDVRVAHRGDDILLEVADTGGGIAPEIQDRVFEPFFSDKSSGDGSGLGLTVCYDITKKHGGTIGFTSTPGEGTVFTVLLPIMEARLDDHYRTRDDPARR